MYTVQCTLCTFESFDIYMLSPENEVSLFLTPQFDAFSRSKDRSWLSPPFLGLHIIKEGGVIIISVNFSSLCFSFASHSCIRFQIMGEGGVVIVTCREVNRRVALIDRVIPHNGLVMCNTLKEMCPGRT